MAIIGYLRSYFKEQNLVVCTATATSDTKSKIFEVLDISNEKTVCIEKSPERSNLVYSFHYIDNDLELQNIFNEVTRSARKRGEMCKNYYLLPNKEAGSSCVESIQGVTWERHVC